MQEDDYVCWLNGMLQKCARISRGPVVACIGTHNVDRIDQLLQATGLRVPGWLSWYRQPRSVETVAVAAPRHWSALAGRVETARREGCCWTPSPESVRPSWPRGAQVADRSDSSWRSGSAGQPHSAYPAPADGTVPASHDP
jgi:hypothetical protein